MEKCSHGENQGCAFEPYSALTVEESMLSLAILTTILIYSNVPGLAFLLRPHCMFSYSSLTFLNYIFIHVPSLCSSPNVLLCLLLTLLFTFFNPFPSHLILRSAALTVSCHFLVLFICSGRSGRRLDAYLACVVTST